METVIARFPSVYRWSVDGGGGLMLTNAGAAGAAPFTGGASAVAVAALDVAVVGWASMNIVNGVRNIELLFRMQMRLSRRR